MFATEMYYLPYMDDPIALSDHYQSPQFCFTVANILQSSVSNLVT